MSLPVRVHLLRSRRRNCVPCSTDDYFCLTFSISCAGSPTGGVKSLPCCSSPRLPGSSTFIHSSCPFESPALVRSRLTPSTGSNPGCTGDGRTCASAELRYCSSHSCRMCGTGRLPAVTSPPHLVAASLASLGRVAADRRSRKVLLRRAKAPDQHTTAGLNSRRRMVLIALSGILRQAAVLFDNVM